MNKGDNMKFKTGALVRVIHELLGLLSVVVLTAGLLTIVYGFLLLLKAGEVGLDISTVEGSFSIGFSIGTVLLGLAEALISVRLQSIKNNMLE